MLYYIIKKQKIRRYILIVSIVYTLVCFKMINGLFVFLLPISVFEFLGAYSIDIKFGILALVIPPFIIGKDIASEYVLISCISYALYILASTTLNKISRLTAEQDNQRIKMYELYDKLDKSLEHEKQLKYTTQLEERNKMAQQLHDKLGHTVSASLMQLEAAKLLMDNDVESSKKMLQNSIDALRAGMENIRATLRDIKPPSEQVGITRIKMMLDDFSVKSSIKNKLIHNGSLDLISYSHWNIMYGNLAESLTNIMKYSKASSVSVSIEVLNKFIKMEVKDNGIGSFEIKKGLGIVGMEERAGSIGGKIIVDGSSGFSVITLLPSGGLLNGYKNNSSR
jgi:signal transduction histidine kinase